MSADEQKVCFRELWDRLAGYITNRAYLALGARRGMMLRAFKAGDLASWLELCTDDDVDLRFNEDMCVFDDAACDARLVWTSANGKTYGLDAIGRYVDLGKSVVSCAWEGDTLRVAGSFKARDLYGLENVSLVVQPRDLRNLAVEVPIALAYESASATDSTSDVAAVDTRATTEVPWSTELPVACLRGLAEDERDTKQFGIDTSTIKYWDFFIKGVYGNGIVALKRIASCGKGPATSLEPHLIAQNGVTDIVALYATAHGNLSVRLLAHDPHLVVDQRRLMSSLTLVIARPTLSKKNATFDVAFEHNGSKRTVRLTANELKKAGLRPFDARGQLQWKPTVTFTSGSASASIPLEVKRCK